jgi:hypothetical protein
MIPCLVVVLLLRPQHGIVKMCYTVSNSCIVLFYDVFSDTFILFAGRMIQLASSRRVRRRGSV